jgi:hypothetical protein
MDIDNDKLEKLCKEPKEQIAVCYQVINELINHYWFHLFAICREGGFNTGRYVDRMIKRCSYERRTELVDETGTNT